MITFPITMMQDQFCVPIQGLDVIPQIDDNDKSEDAVMDTWYRYNFSAMLWLQSEIGSGRKQINGLQFMFGNTIPSFTRSNITVKLYHTTDSVIPSSPTTSLDTQMSGVTDLVTVLDNGTVTIAGSDGAYSTLFTFEENFCYNGVDNLIIQVEDRSNTAGTNYSNMWRGLNNGVATNRNCYSRTDVSYASLNPIRDGFRTNVKLLY